MLKPQRASRNGFECSFYAWQMRRYMYTVFAGKVKKLFMLTKLDIQVFDCGAPWKGAITQWVQNPPGKLLLRPEAIGAV